MCLVVISLIHQNENGLGTVLNRKLRRAIIGLKGAFQNHRVERSFLYAFKKNVCVCVHIYTK